MGIRHGIDVGPSAPSGMHLKVRVLTKPVYLDQALLTDTEAFQGLTILGPAIPAALPDGPDEAFDFLRGRAVTQRPP